jgi:uncharacterized FlaG/YvyC family protein
MATSIDTEIVSSPAVQFKQRVRPAKADIPTEQATAAPAVAAPLSHGFQLRVDQQTREVTVLIVDQETRAVIGEIPAKEMRAASDVIRALIGPLIDKTV